MPDALSNALHGYAEMDKHTDEAIDTIHEVKSTTTEKHSLIPDEDYDEDPFLHALLHNNDDDIHITNVSSESTSSERVDEELFAKLHAKLFPHHKEEHEAKEKEHKAKEKVTYGIREMIEDGNVLFE